MLIPGTNSIKDTGYDVANSCRFNSGDDCKISRTSPNSSPTDIDKFTFSCWIKRSNIDQDSGHEHQQIFTTYDGSGSPYQEFQMYFTNNQLRIQVYNSSNKCELKTNRLFRDTSAWYSIIFSYDSSPSTPSIASVRLWVNGVLETSFATETYPSQNDDGEFAVQNHIQMIGNNDTNARDLGCYLAEVIGVDGQALINTDFGEFSEDSPTIWMPKDVSGINVGTLGFYCDFEDSGTLGNDVSGVGDFTLANLAATDQATDTPTNNFATANPLNVNSGGVSTFAEGNTEVTVNGATGMQFGSSSTLGMTAGKWYCEVKIKTVDSGLIGVSAGASEDARDDYPPGTQGGAESVGILIVNGSRYIDDGGATHGAATSADGIMMIALDLDNNNVYFGTGGNWFDGSGNADEAAPNSAISVTAVGSTTDGAYFFSFGDGGGSAACKVQWNFGNPPYTISSGNADANGYGNFEYAPPTISGDPCLSLCSKNLGSDGG